MPGSLQFNLFGELEDQEISGEEPVVDTQLDETIDELIDEAIYQVLPEIGGSIVLKGQATILRTWRPNDFRDETEPFVLDTPLSAPEELNMETFAEPVELEPCTLASSTEPITGDEIDDIIFGAPNAVNSEQMGTAVATETMLIQRMANLCLHLKAAPGLDAIYCPQCDQVIKAGTQDYWEWLQRIDELTKF